MRRCVVIRTDHLGDLLLTTPLFRALSESGFEVEAVVPGNIRAILDHNPHLKKVHDLQTISPHFPVGWLKLRKWLSRQGYTHIILPNAQVKELVWASAFSGIPVKIAMWSGSWGRILGHEVVRARLRENPQPLAQVILKSAQTLGIDPVPSSPVIRLVEEERIAAKNLLNARLNGGPYIGIHPGSRGSACNLPPQVYGTLAEKILQGTDYKIVVTGTASERGLCDSWSESVRRSPRVWLSMGELVSEGSDLRMLASIIAQLRLLIVPSTGPLQIASALKVSSLSPFCALSERSGLIWGSGCGRSVTPNRSNCEKWKQSSPSYCDFRGEITAERLLKK